ncbi:phosphotransferase [Cytobacillus sp. Hm23]
MNLTFIENLWNISQPYKVTEITIGHFNKIYKIDHFQSSYILRIYESENNINKIKRELKVLNLLKKEHLSFAIPHFKQTVDKEQIVFLPDQNTYAILMPLIKGVHPNLEDHKHQYQSGMALGELNFIFSKMKKGIFSDLNPSYSNLNSFHPDITDIKKIVNHLPSSNIKKEQLQYLFENIFEKIEDVYKYLPKQFIHGDYTNGNRLIHKGSISGIIDFEFFCFDLRVMDLAISIGGGPSALWKHGNGWGIIEAFCKGYFNKFTIADIEIKHIPFLIQVRRIAMLIYFFGRYEKGLDDESWMRGIIDWVLDADEWLKYHSSDLISNLLKWRE